MYISLLVLSLFVECSFSYIFPDSNCTQGCTLKQHLQCKIYQDYACPRQTFSHFPPGKPSNLNVISTYIHHPSPHARTCDAALNITWWIPTDASRVFVEGFQVQVISLQESGLQRCVVFNLSKANWTEDDEWIQYFYHCLTVTPGDYYIEVASLPSNIKSSSAISRSISVKRIYPGRDGSCVLPTPRPPATLRPTSTTHRPEMPPTPNHKLNIKLILIVTSGCLLFVAISTFGLLALWRWLSTTEVDGDREQIWTNGMPQSGLNNTSIDYPWIPPIVDNESVSTEVTNSMITGLNRSDAYGGRIPPSENICNSFGPSACDDYSSELCCDCCGASFEGGMRHDWACQGVGSEHHLAGPGVEYEGRGNHAVPGIGNEDWTFDRTGRSNAFHPPNNLGFDLQSVGRGEM